jgi:hypothetical protein
MAEENKSNERKRLTIGELRKMKNYEDVTDEQAQEIIFAVQNLAVMFYEHLNKKKKEDELKKEKENEADDSGNKIESDKRIKKVKKAA